MKSYSTCIGLLGHLQISLKSISYIGSHVWSCGSFLSVFQALASLNFQDLNTE
ncbi:hypothetical protein STRDD11_02040 [Streptococcus sp. DD11]|nr:hypothetical protein STRDD11_02040 [Streptococcus sp. DD11]